MNFASVALSIVVHAAVLLAMSRLPPMPKVKASSVVSMKVRQTTREPPPPPPPIIPPPDVVPKKVKVRTVEKIVKDAPRPEPPKVEPPPPPLAFAVDMASTVEGGGGVAVPVVEGGGNMFADPSETGLPKGKATAPPPSSGKGKGAGAYQITDEPRFLTPESERAPPYPRAARSLELEGKVLLRIYIDELGKVADVKVLEPLGGGCTEAAVKWAKTKWRFAPAKAGTEAVGMWITVPVRFILER